MTEARRPGARPGTPPAGSRADLSRRAGLSAAASFAVVGLLPAAGVGRAGASPSSSTSAPSGLALPAPRRRGDDSLEVVLAARRSVRRFAGTPLTLAEAGQLLWAAQGESSGDGKRTAPSAGATYPLEVCLVAARVGGLAPGVYRYRPHGHRIEAVAAGDAHATVAAASPGQTWLAQAPAFVVIAAEPGRTAARYGSRAGRYVAIEAGAAAQSLLLQAVALGLGATLVGAFDDAALHATVSLAEAEQPLAVVAVGGP